MLSPGFVRTERNTMGADVTGMDPSLGAPPEAVGAAVAWMVTNPGADVLMRGNIDAQTVASSEACTPIGGPLPEPGRASNSFPSRCRPTLSCSAPALQRPRF